MKKSVQQVGCLKRWGEVERGREVGGEPPLIMAAVFLTSKPPAGNISVLQQKR